MSVTDLGSNIERLRKGLSIKVKELCEQVEISDTSYRNIRKGIHQPHSRTVKAIAKILKVSVFDLYKESPTLKTLRFRSNASSDNEELQQKEIVFDVARKLEHYNELIELLGDKKRKSPQLVKLQKFFKKNKNIEVLAKEVRKLFELNESEPIVDICSLFESRGGVHVFSVASKLEYFWGACLSEEDGGPAICVNTRENITIEKQIFTCAHELGHLIMHSGQGKQTKEEIDDEDRAADKFAGYFLAPLDAVKKKLQEARGLHFVDAIFHVKSHFNVSCLAMLYNVAETLGIEHDKLKLFFIESYQGKFDKKWDWKKEPEGIPETRFKEDLLPLLVRRAYEAEKISISKAAEILQLSLVEMRKIVAWWHLSGKLFK